MSEVLSGCAVRAAIQESNRVINETNKPLGPDLNSLVYWVRKLVHADCGDDAVRALAELSKIERQLPR